VATTLPVQSGTHFATEAIVGHIEESIGRFTGQIPAAVRTLHLEHTGSMNPKHLAPPVVALALAAIIFNAKRNDISGMRNGNDELRERIATARLADSSQEAAQPARHGATREPIDWNQLATMFRGGGDDSSIGVLTSKRQLLTLDTAGSVEQATGVALGLALGGAGSMNIHEASALVLGYHARSGDDSALVRYLFNLPIDDRNHPETKKVVEKITDPNREEMLRGF